MPAAVTTLPRRGPGQIESGNANPVHPAGPKFGEMQPQTLPRSLRTNTGAMTSSYGSSTSIYANTRCDMLMLMPLCLCPYAYSYVMSYVVLRRYLLQ